MVTVMLIASPPVVSQTVEDEDRKKEKDREKESYHLFHNLNRKTNWKCYCSEKHDHIDSKQHIGNSDWQLHHTCTTFRSDLVSKNTANRQRIRGKIHNLDQTKGGEYLSLATFCAGVCI